MRFIILHRGDGHVVRVNPARINWYGPTEASSKRTVVSFSGADGIPVIETPEQIDAMLEGTET